MTYHIDDLRLILANAKVYRLEKELEAMTEARGAVAAGSKYLRDKCDLQADILTMIAKHGTANPGWAVKLAKAAVESA